MKRYNDTIYSVGKDKKIRTFRIEVEHKEDFSLVKGFSGKLGGKEVKNTRTITKGKNTGKANATTIEEQAEKEAYALHTKKIKEGYKDFNMIQKHLVIYSDKPITGQFTKDQLLETYAQMGLNSDGNYNTQPMLAHKYKDHHKKMKFPCFAQYKYDGVRCKGFNDKYNGGSYPTLLSREGEQYKVDHILKELASLQELKKGYELDGELYIHGKPLQDIVHLVRTPSMETPLIKYMVYDLACFNKPQYERLTILTEMLSFNDLKHIVLAPTIIVNNKETLYTLFDEARKQGFEGVIARHHEGLYEFGYRSHSLLKVKDTITEEVIILGVDLKLGSPITDFVWVCKTQAGVEFKVKPHGTLEQRKDYYNNYNNYIGKKLTIEYHGMTKDNVPFHVTSVVVRDYE